MKRILLMGGILLVMTGALAFAGTQDVYLYVTPTGITTTLSKSGDVAFGDQAINTSTCSATGVLITNTGTVSVEMDKTVMFIRDDGVGDDVWALAESTGTVDQCVLWCYANATEPALGDYGTAGSYTTAVSSFSTTFNTFNALKNGAGTQITLTPGQGTTTWFRLDMPNTVSTSNEKHIGVRFQSTMP
ncbi:MAG: hypothetical protein JXJ19_00945 [Elusimicrobia bacterium]|nr:hypothetical protein [Elusimicrobiota bacterium]